MKTGSSIDMDSDGVNPPMEHKERPLGVIIFGILSLILGFGSVAAGIRLVTFGPVYLSWIGMIAGVVLVGIGIAEGVFGLGCFMAWPWAWVLGVILLVIGILLQFFILVALIISVGVQLDYYTPEIEVIIGIIIDGIIIYYLFRPHVKAYFGRA